MKNKNKGINFKILLPIILLIVLSVLGYNQIFKTPSIIMEDMSQSIPIQNRDHINQSETLQVYNSNPPTSGPHAGAIKGGFYSEEILDINGVHNLEHGYIWITYRNISPVAQATLKKIAKRYSGRVLVSERMANDTQIAMASWGRLDKMTESTFDEDYALRFIKKYTNKSPEKFAK
ncbi:DUF3105 domain-containing protein [Candidatus Thioglobus sp.]|jgi:hypothetical protein|nr:DUF3105 domain-containing protein [Candidatus Thioglobus sp.]